MQPETATICAALQELQVRRKFCIGLATKQTNATGALVRRALGFKWDDDEAKREGVKARCAKIVSAALAGKDHTGDNQEVAELLSADFAVVIQALAPLEKRRNEIERDMAKLARKLPGYAFAESVKGFGDKAFAVLVGETGDLSNYSKADKLWKRLGLAPFEGKAFSTWRKTGGLTAEDWTAAGYAPRRRAEIHSCVSDPLFRWQTKSQGPYRAVYDARRAKMTEAYPERSKGHLHNDALRIMTKKLVSDLWSEWRGAMIKMPETADERLPLPQLIAAE